jgi:NADH-quinone oxidoreductase subunit H
VVLVLYFIFFGSLGMALGAGEGGHPYSAIGVSRGLAQVTAAEIPLVMAIIGVAMHYDTLSVTEMVAAQQGGIASWTLFTNPLITILGMVAYLGAMSRSPFDVVLAPQEIPIGPPTEYHSSFLGVLQTNRSIFPMAKTILFVNIFFGGATNWPVLILKAFLLYMWSVVVAVVFPRFRVDQSIRWWYKYALPLGIIAIMVTQYL